MRLEPTQVGALGHSTCVGRLLALVPKIPPVVQPGIQRTSWPDREACLVAPLLRFGVHICPGATGDCSLLTSSSPCSTPRLLAALACAPRSRYHSPRHERTSGFGYCNSPTYKHNISSRSHGRARPMHYITSCRVKAY